VKDRAAGKSPRHPAGFSRRLSYPLNIGKLILWENIRTPMSVPQPGRANFSPGSCAPASGVRHPAMANRRVEDRRPDFMILLAGRIKYRARDVDGGSGSSGARSKSMVLRRAIVLMLCFSLSSCNSIDIRIDTDLPLFRVGIEPPEETLSPSATPSPLRTAFSPSATQRWTPSPSRTQTASATLTPRPAVEDLAAGGSHACAVMSSGALWCWGKNDHGQLGDGTADDRTTPVRVAGLEGVKAVAAGWGHTCALTGEGGVKCWGYDKNGELGNGSTVDSRTPVDVEGLPSGVTAIFAGDDHTCVLTDAGSVKCWGFNAAGQLGDGTAVNSITPVEVAGIPGGVSAIAAGWGHTCALSDRGGVLCWGDNEYGQLGNDLHATYRTWGEMVTGLEAGVSAISAGGGHACALTDRGGVLCWGNNKYGELGDGTSQNRPIPVVASGLYAGATDISAGWNHTCALIRGGGMMCWGRNYYGQLGDGTTITRVIPVNVAGLRESVAKASLGNDFTCALTTGGRVMCWGKNENGQLGDGTTKNRSAAVDVAGW
jgi:alpha-tubulin suppressor-like RCC1 family protein